MNKLLTVVMMLALVAVAACGSPTAPTPTVAPPTQAPATQPTAIQPPPTAAPSPKAAPATPTTEAVEEEAYPAPPQGVAPDVYPYPEPKAGAAIGRWVFDGIISEGEYDHQIVVGPVAIFWANDDTHLYIAAEAQTTGWLGVGVDPDNRMQGADYIIAAIDGEPKIWDAWGQRPVGATHPPDTEIGGAMDIVAWAVVQDGPFMRFEALRLLDSGDPYDKPVQQGQTYDIIVGVGVSPAFNAPHSYRGWGQITLD